MNGVLKQQIAPAFQRIAVAEPEFVPVEFQGHGRIDQIKLAQVRIPGIELRITPGL